MNSFKLMNYNLDLNSIKPTEIDSWFSTFFYPFDWINFTKIESEIKSILNEVISNETDTYIKDLLTINYHIHISYIGYIYVEMMKTSLIQRNIKPIYDQCNLYLNEIMSTGYTINNYSLVVDKKEISVVGQFLKSISFNLQKKSFPLFPLKILGDTASHSTIEYLKNISRSSVIWQPAYKYFKNSGGSSKAAVRTFIRIKEIIFYFGNTVEAICCKYGLKFNPIQKHKLFELHSIAFKKIIDKYFCFDNTTKSSKLPEEYYIGSNNNYILRTLSAILNERNHKVFGFAHGNPFWHLYDLTSWLELSLDSHFVVYTAKSGEILRSVRENYPAPNNNNCKIISSSTLNTKFLIPQKNKNIDNSRKSNSILIVAPPFIKEAVPFSNGLPNLILFYLIKDTINKLNSLNFRIVYQKHPGGMKINQFEKKLGNIEISNETFEKIYKNYDFLFFFHTRTSTITTALTSNKPIVICIGHNEPEIHPTMKEKLSMRCEFLELEYTENFLVKANEEKLNNALTCAINKIDNCEFISDYLNIDFV